MWPGVCPGAGSAVHPGGPGRGARGSSARATLPRLPFFSAACIRRGPISRITGRMTHRSSGPPHSRTARSSGSASGRSRGCIHTSHAHSCASSRAAPAWSGWQCVSRMAAGRDPSPNSPAAACRISAACFGQPASTRHQRSRDPTRYTLTARRPAPSASQCTSRAIWSRALTSRVSSRADPCWQGGDRLTRGGGAVAGR